MSVKFITSIIESHIENGSSPEQIARAVILNLKNDPLNNKLIKPITTNNPKNKKINNLIKPKKSQSKGLPKSNVF